MDRKEILNAAEKCVCGELNRTTAHPRITSD